MISRKKYLTPFRLHPTVLLLAATHLMVDGYGNIYAPLLPLLIQRHTMDLRTAGTLAMLFQIAASVCQLAFGRLADRWRPRVLLRTGPIVAVTLLSLIGLAPSVPALAAILVAGGFGCAMFHPPGAALTHRLGRERPGLAMSVYITGGSLGFALGPLFFAPFVERFGLEWSPVVALPGLILAGIAASRMPPIEPVDHGTDGGFRTLRPYFKPLACLYLIVVLRTFTSLGFATFVPVMLTRRGVSLGAAGAQVALYLFASGLGGFLGGPSADRWGARRVIMISLAASAPFLAVAPLVDGWSFAILLAIGGFFLQSTLPVNVTFGQALAPVSAATVSSLMMGFAWGSGGLSVPLVGLAADRFGIEPTLVALSAGPIAAMLCALPLPARPIVHTPAQPAPVAMSEPAE
jgi:FSR family fosmidomycin resistance protein-like MFS transporter